MPKRTIPLVVLLAALAAAAFASTVTRLSFRQLSQMAHRVAVGKIEKLTSYQDPSSGRIYSDVQISETRALGEGLPRPALTFRMAGGTVGDLRQWIAGFPALQAGDRVVLFLGPDTTTPLGPTIGLWQGVFFVDAEAASGRETVLDHRRLPVAEIRGDELVAGEAGAARASRLGLDVFLERVRALRAPAGEAPARR